MTNISCTCQFLIKGEIIVALWNLFQIVAEGLTCEVECELFKRLPFLYCSRFTESVRITAFVLWLTAFVTSQWRAHVTASTSIVMVAVLCLYAVLFSWIVAPACLTVYSQPDQCSVTDPSMYTRMSVSFVVCSRMVLISCSVLPATHSWRCLPRQPCSIKV